MEQNNTQKHYNSKDGNSVYKFADNFELNSYEFDIIKRIVRCRKKGNFVEDLLKTKDLIDIYLIEQSWRFDRKEKENNTISETDNQLNYFMENYKKG